MSLFLSPEKTRTVGAVFQHILLLSDFELFFYQISRNIQANTLHISVGTHSTHTHTHTHTCTNTPGVLPECDSLCLHAACILFIPWVSFLVSLPVFAGTLVFIHYPCKTVSPGACVRFYLNLVASATLSIPEWQIHLLSFWPGWAQAPQSLWLPQDALALPMAGKVTSSKLGTFIQIPASLFLAVWARIP
jgi:hypothetical protein